MPPSRNDSELVFGLVSPVGTDTDGIILYINEHLAKFGYSTETISVSRDVLSRFSSKNLFSNEYERVMHFMDLGNRIRLDTSDTSILMKGVAAYILEKRNADIPSPRKRIAYIIKSIKHPDEVSFLRKLYGVGFHLIGVTSTRSRRKNYLMERKALTPENADELLDRDYNESVGHGQQTQKTFQHSDYFVTVDNSPDDTRNSIYRLIDLLFGDPFLTPNFDEYAMFMAFASSLRSADLSRQVGAVIAKDKQILATGANDCPCVSGGLYWPELVNSKYEDKDRGRDHTWGYDSNKKEQSTIIREILKNLELEVSKENIRKVKNSGIGDLTEYGRVVHGEMEAIMMCARNNISSIEGTLYVTTFPCHNCAKHIIASGIKKVVYIEPYPKSKAIEFHPEEITEDKSDTSKVQFVPFDGVGPHRFTDLFSVASTLWYDRIRKDSEGNKINWTRSGASVRTPMPLFSYIESEKAAYKAFYEEVEASISGGNEE